MSARAGMSSIIELVRTLTFAGTAEWTLGTANYWDDDHIQQQLDFNREDFYEVELEPVPQVQAALGDAASVGTVAFKRYQIPYYNIESIDSGTAIFNLAYANGGTVSEAFTVDYFRGLVTFTNDQGGTPFYLTGRAYDLNKTAADIWDAKAAHYAQAYDVETDSHKLSRSQLAKQCQDMAKRYRNMAGPSVISIERDDTE
jgi:hypothetical protein